MATKPLVDDSAATQDNIKKTGWASIEGFLQDHSGMIGIISIIITILSVVFGVTNINQTITMQNTNMLENINSAQNINSVNNTNAVNTSTIISINTTAEYTDYLEKAKSGNTYAQLWVAENYTEAGNYADAIYWYKNIIDTATDQDIAIAYNNLGWLYVNGYGLSNYGRYDSKRFEEAYNCFRKASDLGLQIGTDNTVIVLKFPCSRHFEEISLEEKRDFLIEHDTGEPKLAAYTIEYRYDYFQTPKGKTYSTEYAKYTYSGSVTLPDATTGFTSTYYVYYGLVYDVDVGIKNCSFCNLYNKE